MGLQRCPCAARAALSGGPAIRPSICYSGGTGGRGLASAAVPSGDRDSGGSCGEGSSSGSSSEGGGPGGSSGEVAEVGASGAGGGGGGGVLGSIQPRMMMAFTCTQCDTRSTKSFSRSSYTQGVVLIRCPGCEQLHLIADHLGWFGEEPFVLHEFMAAAGASIVRIMDGASAPTPADGAVAPDPGSAAGPGTHTGSAMAERSSGSCAAAAARGGGGGAVEDPGVAARTAAAARAAAAGGGGVFELSSALQVQAALAEARGLRAGAAGGRRGGAGGGDLGQRPEDKGV